jgi:arsenate reductase
MLDEFITDRFEYVITVCDDANEACPFFPNAQNRWHWSIEEPSSVGGSEAVRLEAFREAREVLRQRIALELLPSLTGLSGSTS